MTKEKKVSVKSGKKSNPKVEKKVMLLKRNRITQLSMRKKKLIQSQKLLLL